MKVVLSIFVLISAAFSAPIAEDAEQRPESLLFNINEIDYLRAKRSNENQYGITPCAAAAAASARSTPQDMTYQNNRPLHAPNPYDYGHSGYGNIYRPEDPYNEPRETMRFSDINTLQAPAARWNYRTAPSLDMSANAPNLVTFNGQMNQVVPMYGMYPSASVGCNVPLYFSCTPSIVPAPHLAYGNPIADAYVGLNDRYFQSLQENHEEQKIHDVLAPVKSEQSKGKHV